VDWPYCFQLYVIFIGTSRGSQSPRAYSDAGIDSEQAVGRTRVSVGVSDYPHGLCRARAAVSPFNAGCPAADRATWGGMNPVTSSRRSRFFPEEVTDLLQHLP